MQEIDQVGPINLWAEIQKDKMRPYTPAQATEDAVQVFTRSVAGRRMLGLLLDWGGVMQPIAADGDPYETYRRDGARMMALRLVKLLTDSKPEQQEVSYD